MGARRNRDVAQRIIDLHRKSSDANVGATLLRLASLAMVRHAYEKAIDAAQQHQPADEAEHRIREDLERANGTGPRPTAPRTATAQAAAPTRTDHKEVLR